MKTSAHTRFSAALLLALVCASPEALAAGDGTTPATTTSDTAEATQSKAAEKSAAPVRRKVVFQPKASASFKHKLQIYNRSKDHAEQLYCREDRVTGSHRKRMRCVTNEERQMEEDAARLFFDSLPVGSRGF